MSNLVPVKRVNKNGVMVTKHVRADATQHNGSLMPAPSLAKHVKSARVTKERAALDKRLKRMDKPRNRSFNRKKMGIYGTPVLEKLFKTTYKFNCSDNDFYTLLERLRLSDVFILMSAGLKPEQRDAFIERNNFHHYEEDNAELVEGLRSRGIPLDNYLETVNNPVLEYIETPLLLDAAETYVMFSHEDYSYAKGILPGCVGSKIVSLDDIKALGVNRCGYSDFIYLLPEFKNGNAKCTAVELAEMLDRLKESDDDDLDHRILESVRSRLAVKFGVPFMESVDHPMSLWYAESYLVGMDDDTAVKFLNYVDKATWDETIPKFDNETKWVQIAADKKTLWESGIDADTAREGLESGMTAEQIIGVHQHGIAPIVSSGWL